MGIALALSGFDKLSPNGCSFVSPPLQGIVAKRADV
jgi:hypothetical protein